MRANACFNKSYVHVELSLKDNIIMIQEQKLK